MKRLDYTKVSVKLKKSEWRDEWFIYLEAYPVYETGNDKPKRVREYLRRSITTPIWDKRRSERAVAGRIKYKPKRDDNGVIQCKSKQDMETCLYADGVRVLRQKSTTTWLSLLTSKWKWQNKANAQMQCSGVYWEVNQRKRGNCVRIDSCQLAQIAHTVVNVCQVWLHTVLADWHEVYWGIPFLLDKGTAGWF